MLTQKDVRLLSDDYFKILRCTETFCEIQSKNTKHCWIVTRFPAKSRRPIRLYHKHTLKTAYYHNHAETYNVEHAIKLIKNHDNYILHPECHTAATSAK
jgi:hypothetical protein